MINPDINFAPIAALIHDWQRSGYSAQTLRYLLTMRLKSARWHARYGVREWRPVQWTNVGYLQWVLDGMEAREAA